MNEIERLLRAYSDRYAFTPEDLTIIKEMMIKAAFAAILDGNVAISINQHVASQQKDKTNVS